MRKSTDTSVLIHDKTGAHSGALDYTTNPPTLVCPTWCTEGRTTHEYGESHTHRHRVTVPAGGPATCVSTNGLHDPTEVTVTIGQYIGFGGTVLRPEIEVTEPYFDLSVDQAITPAGALAMVAAMTQALAVVLTASLAPGEPCRGDHPTRAELAALVDERLAGMVSELRATLASEVGEVGERRPDLAHKPWCEHRDATCGVGVGGVLLCLGAHQEVILTAEPRYLPDGAEQETPAVAQLSLMVDADSAETRVVLGRNDDAGAELALDEALELSLKLAQIVTVAREAGTVPRG